MMPFVNVSAEDNFDYWHQITCRNYSYTECSRVPDEFFAATVTTQHVGGLTLSNISSRTGGGHQLRLKRERGHIRKDGREEFFLWVGREGTTMLEQQGHTATLLPGQIMLMDQTKPFELAFGNTSATTLIIIDRKQLISRVPWIENGVAKTIPANKQWSSLFVSLVDSVASSSKKQEETFSAKMEIIALDMWAEILSSALTNHGAAPRLLHQKLRQVQKFLLANLDDCDLDNEKIAKAVNVSSRTLLRLFAEEGTTPMRWLTRERLRASRAALERQRFNRITDVVYAFGFRNHSHFSRTFKALYGFSPRELLKRS